ncbi:MAG: hypothetical protein IKY52_14910 [Clostridia bacterium]|nr:hypothetical protein [Clostridia bacterium]
MLQFLVLCAIFLTYPAVMLVREIRFLYRTRRCTERVDGKIVRMEEKSPSCAGEDQNSPETKMLLTNSLTIR